MERAMPAGAHGAPYTSARVKTRPPPAGRSADFRRAGAGVLRAVDTDVHGSPLIPD
jgi:hypothetical protein